MGIDGNLIKGKNSNVKTFDSIKFVTKSFDCNFR